MASGRRDVDDYSFSRPAMGALARGVMRYLYGNGKGLTASEVGTLRGAGKIVGLNYEAGAGDFNSAAVGRQHAVAAAQFAARLPVQKAPIIFSADWPVTVGQFRAVGDALEAAAGVLGWGWVGLYGHAGLMDYIAQRFGAAAFRWQTYAWSGGRLSAAADLYQFLNGQNITGGQVDFNQIVGRNFLTALTGGSPASSGATPLSEEDIMAVLSDQQAAKLMLAVDKIVGHNQPGSAIATDLDLEAARNALAADAANNRNMLAGFTADKVGAVTAIVDAMNPSTGAGVDVDALAAKLGVVLAPNIVKQLGAKLVA